MKTVFFQKFRHRYDRFYIAHRINKTAAYSQSRQKSKYAACKKRYRRKCIGRIIRLSLFFIIGEKPVRCGDIRIKRTLIIAGRQFFRKGFPHFFHPRLIGNLFSHFPVGGYIIFPSAHIDKKNDISVFSVAVIHIGKAVRRISYPLSTQCLLCHYGDTDMMFIFHNGNPCSQIFRLGGVQKTRPVKQRRYDFFGRA